MRKNAFINVCVCAHACDTISMLRLGRLTAAVSTLIVLAVIHCGAAVRKHSGLEV